MKPEPRVVKKPSDQFEPHADEKHVMMYQRKAKSDKKLGKSKKKLAERKQVLRAEASKNETDIDKETKRKKETERKKNWWMKQKHKMAEKDDDKSRKKRQDIKKK